MACLLLAAGSASAAVLLEEPFEDERGIIAKGGWIYGQPAFDQGKRGKGLVIDAKHTREDVRPGVSFPAGGNFALESGAVEIWVKPFADGGGLGTAYFFSTREPRLVGEPEWNRNRFALYACATAFRRSDHILFFVIWDRHRKPHRVWTNVTSWKPNEWHKLRVEWRLNDGAGKCRMALLVDDRVAADKPDDDSAIEFDGIGDWLDFGYRRHESGNVGQFWGMLDDLKIEGSAPPLPGTDAPQDARRLQAKAGEAIDWSKARELIVNGDFENADPKTGGPLGWRVPKPFCSLSATRARRGKRSLRVHIPRSQLEQLRKVKDGRSRFGTWYFLEFGQTVPAPKGYKIRGRFECDVYAETPVPWFRVGTPMGGPPVDRVGKGRLPVGKWAHLSAERILPRGKSRFAVGFSCNFTDHYGTLGRGQSCTFYLDRVSFKTAGE